jgi:hypothetical protein
MPRRKAGQPVVKSFRDFSSVQVKCIALGASRSLGSLSVPSAWPKATPKSEIPPPPAKGKPPGLTYQDGLMGVMTGRPATPDLEQPLAEEA